MNPEDLIAAFLKVWETNPDDIFQTSGAIAGLQTLSDTLDACQNKSNQEILDELATWCRKYPTLTEKLIVTLGDKKITSQQNIPPQDIPPQVTVNKTYMNQYPKISQILRDRVPSTETTEGQSQSS